MLQVKNIFIAINERKFKYMTEIIGVRFKSVGKVYYFSPGELKINQGDSVIVETARGVECGEVVCGNREVDDDTLLLAAGLAAANSKAKDSSSVPVDYTLARYVKKPSGARPGAVIYTNQKTLFVTPEK